MRPSPGHGPVTQYCQPNNFVCGLMSSTMITIIQEDIASVCFTERLTDNNAIILNLNFEYPTFQSTFLVKVSLCLKIKIKNMLEKIAGPGPGSA